MMGMFDNIKCKMPLPNTDIMPEGFTFQTKDTPEQQLTNYTISKDGRLKVDDLDINYHGIINFYDYDTDQEIWWEYQAKFTDGICKDIKLISFDTRP